MMIKMSVSQDICSSMPMFICSALEFKSGVYGRVYVWMSRRENIGRLKREVSGNRSGPAASTSSLSVDIYEKAKSGRCQLSFPSASQGQK